MTESTPPSLTTPSVMPPIAPPKRRRRWLWVGGGVLAFVLIIVAAVAITIWWIQRPITPVVLTAQEKAVVDAKLRQVSGDRNETLSPAPHKDVAPNPSIDPPLNRYVRGGKELRLTERELNGLVNQNTDLGKTVRLELDRDAINAYLAVPIPQDFPIGGGKMFRAKGRFRMSLSQDQAPVAMLEDVTVLGVSLPKEWLGGVKGKNLLAAAVGERSDASTWKGVKSLRVVPGAIVLEVGD